MALDPDRSSGSGSNKTFELPGITLAPNTDLAIAGANTLGIRLTGALTLQGDATLRGSSSTGKNGLLTLDGGIAGGPTTTLAIAGGASLPDLTINTGGTYGGGTAMNGGTVTLNATNALGSGQVALAGGTLVVNTDGALTGTVNVTGGTLRANGISVLSGNPIVLNGGTLDLRANTTSSYAAGALNVSGTSTLNVANNGSGSSQTITTPAFNVSGITTLALTSANSFTPNLGGIVLAGDLTLNHASGTVRVQGITEDASPRRLLKSGAGTLQLEAANFFTGGTEVLDGILLVKHAGALGSGALTLGAASGTLAATAQFDPGLTITNDLVARSGGSGTRTLSSPTGNVTWTGAVDLQQTLTLYNGSINASALNGRITGPGNLIMTGTGTITLGDASNNFGGGLSNSVTITTGTLAVASDGALGNPANGVTLAASNSVFKASGTFSTSRVFTLASNSDIEVSNGNTLTLTSAITSPVAFSKNDKGTLEIAAGVDSSARGPADTFITEGTLRLHSPNSLSAAGRIANNSGSGTLELLSDADTDFAHPISVNGAFIIHTDRAASGSNGRHTLGPLSLTATYLTITGAHGYGLSLGAVNFNGSNDAGLFNDSAAPLILASLTSTADTGTRNLQIGGNGDTWITGAISQTTTGPRKLTKMGLGTLRFGTAVSGFGSLTTVEEGTLDLNGLGYNVTTLVIGGAATPLGARIVTGASGAILLAGNLTANTTTGAAPSLITGTLDLSAATHTLTVNDNTNNPVDLTIDGPITGSPGTTLTKAGAGTLRLTGITNPQPGLVSVSNGVLELAKSSGNAIGSGGLAITGGIARLLADEQIDDTAAITLNSANYVLLELGGFTETTGAIAITQTDANDYSAVRTGTSGTLVLHGNLDMSNNTNTSATDARQILITGSGTDTTSASDGTLDLGGAVRTVRVATTTTGQYEPKANATIETRVINGGILKTGPRTLYLTHPDNDLAAGLQIAEGALVLGTGNPTSLGSGGIALSNTGSNSASLVLTQLAGVFSNNIDVTPAQAQAQAQAQARLR